MKAAVLTAFGQPLELEELEPPEPGDEEALVRVRATGVCATDLKVASGALAHVEVPRVLGHEVAGELVEPAVGLSAGQRVACYLYSSCGECRYCLLDRPTLCIHAERIGIERDGGMAEYMTLPAANLLPFDSSLSFAAAAVTMDAVMTPWRALRSRAALQADETVAVVGAGGLGLNAVQIAADAGARAAVVDLDEDHRERALSLGAELAVAPDGVDRIRNWSGGGVDVGLDTSGARAGFDSAVACLRPGGRLLCCGYKPGIEYGLDSAELVLGEITVMGSRAGRLEDARGALAAVQEGRIRPPIMEELGLEEANLALERLREGTALGRQVLSTG